MRMKLISLPTLAAMATAAALLAACGGGGGGGDEPVAVEDPTLVPSSATGSTAAWFKFARALAPVDDAEALKLTSVGELPTSETEEPQAVAQ